MHILRSFIVLAALAIAVGACVAAGTPRTISDSGTPVSVGTTSTAQYGTILVGANGMSLYTNAGDSDTASTCSGPCLTAWPPLTVAEGQQAVGASGVNGTFGTFARSDGILQVTYDGRPLYYSQGDKIAGDVTVGLDGFSVAKP